MDQTRTISVFGAGMVAQPLIDYLCDQCGWSVILVDQDINQAMRRAKNRAKIVVQECYLDQNSDVSALIKRSDLVVSLLPPDKHSIVARHCLLFRKPLVTTSYINPEMSSLDSEARSRGILLLNEIGEDPGLDHMLCNKLIKKIKSKGGQVTSVASYGAGLPALESNDNPFQFKLSWSPKGLLAAVQSSAVFVIQGKVVRVPGKALLDRTGKINVPGLEEFESYPNRDSSNYIHLYGLDQSISFFRGLLRYKGWCRLFAGLKKMGLFDERPLFDGRNLSFNDALSLCLGEKGETSTKMLTTDRLQCKIDDDIIFAFEWLGLFSNTLIPRKCRSPLDLLLELMTNKLSYKSGDKDMIIVHCIVSGNVKGEHITEKATIIHTAEFGDYSAMAQAVTLPAAIAAKNIVQKKIKLKGVHIPNKSEIYETVLNELLQRGFKITFQSDVQ